jgi:hypothetical protein
MSSGKCNDGPCAFAGRLGRERARRAALGGRARGRSLARGHRCVRTRARVRRRQRLTEQAPWAGAGAGRGTPTRPSLSAAAPPAWSDRDPVHRVPAAPETPAARWHDGGSPRRGTPRRAGDAAGACPHAPTRSLGGARPGGRGASDTDRGRQRCHDTFPGGGV